MHYHLSQHTGERLPAAARCVQGVHNLSNSNSSPNSALQPLGPSVPAGTAFDRMEADIKVLQQQAMATQASIQQLNARPAVDPWTAIQSKVPTLPAVDMTVIGVSVVLAAVVASTWWYSRRRPKTLHTQEAPEYPGIPDPHAAFGTIHNPQSEMPVANTWVAPVAASGSDYAGLESPPPLQTPATTSLFSRLEVPIGFDSEAAASEVTRVRKSLAEKREARAQQREYAEDTDSAPIPVTAEVPYSEWPAPAASDPDAFLSMAGHLLPVFEAETVCEPEQAPSVEEVTTEPKLEPDQPLGPDFTVTLALAQESEVLELWDEARELAKEVLESTDPELQAQATVLIQRMDAKLHDIAQESKFLDFEL